MPGNIPGKPENAVPFMGTRPPMNASTFGVLDKGASCADGNFGTATGVENVSLG